MCIIQSMLQLIMFGIIEIIKSIVKLFIPLKNQMKNISGEIALVTGAAGGLGRALALNLVNHGAIVVIWDINQKGIDETMKLIKAAGGTCYGYICDVRNREDIYKKAKLVQAEVGQVNILINNAGVINIGIFWKTPDNLLSHVMEVNILSQFWTVKAFLPEMIESNKGHIVNIASIAGLIGFPTVVDYCTSKYAAIGFSEALQMELDFHGHDIKTTVVCPIFIHNTGISTTKYSGIFSTLSPQEVAERTITSLRCNTELVLLPSYMQFVLFFKRILPRYFFFRVLRSVFKHDPTEFEPIESRKTSIIN
ncbi:estradiol 17-beta-dehydrogenase 11-like [Vespula pensylvanica]|uniref:estradiol 17-beta-dehydrogenase 11-like n=1 Tax=Vespula pensylvanica TaxID=30213 RepID=UPI001CBA11AA|nr:estradiol 17-beta-dehydrogenase 11-like [Vespula pensylvanica]